MTTKYNYQQLSLTKKILSNSKFINIIKDLYPELILSNTKYNLKLLPNTIQLFAQDQEKFYLNPQDEHKFTLIKHLSDTLIEINNIAESSQNINILTQIIEIRPKGIIITQITRNYQRDEYSTFFLTKINSTRNIFSQTTINNQYPDLNLFADSIEKIYSKIFPTPNSETSLSVTPDFKIKFTAALNKDSTPNIYITLNEQDISFLYTNIKGLDPISIIYSLSQGLITPKNLNAFHLINIGELDETTFDLNRAYRFTEQEEQLVGKSLISKSPSYHQFVQQYLTNYYQTTCNNLDDNNEILKCITSKTPTSLGTRYLPAEEIPGSAPNSFPTYTITEVLNTKPKRKRKIKRKSTKT